MYRDELEASRARMESLEAELRAARSEVQELRDRQSHALAMAERGGLRRGNGRSLAARWSGAPIKLSFEHKLFGELPTSAHAELIECIRDHTDNVGTSNILHGSLAWTSSGQPPIHLTITARDGETKIRVSASLGYLAGAIYGGVGGGAGGGLMIAPIFASLWWPGLAVLIIPSWIGGWYSICRKLYKGVATRHAQRLQDLADDLAEICVRAINDVRSGEGQPEPVSEPEE